MECTKCKFPYTKRDVGFFGFEEDNGMCPTCRRKAWMSLYPIVIGNCKDIENDTIIGWASPPKNGKGVTRPEIYQLEKNGTFSTKAILAITSGAYSLKAAKGHK
jgi:hypothetical protein